MLAKRVHLGEFKEKERGVKISGSREGGKTMERKPMGKGCFTEDSA